jgi:hypothetical protein
MFVADVVFLQWEIVRLRRLKLSLLKTSGHEALEEFLVRRLDYDLYAEAFTKDLAENLQKYIEEDEAQELAKQCAWSEPGADEKVHRVLIGRGGPDMHEIMKMAKEYEIMKVAKEYTAKDLARAYARHEPKAIKQVNRILAYSGLTLHDIMAKGLTAKIEVIERIDRLITTPRVAATLAYARSIGIVRRSAKRCGGTCKRLRTPNSK